MENNSELYNLIKNPLDSDTIKKLLIIYAEGGDFYSNLVKQHSNEKDYKGKYNPEMKDKLFAKLFRIWKENILNLTTNQITTLIKNNSDIDNDFFDLQRYLKTIDVTTEQQFRKLVDKTQLIHKYGWQKLGEGSDWIHISSRYLKSKNEKAILVEHRLYLNTDGIYTELIISLFIEKCLEKSIPFYLKYDERASRDDTLVIYSDTKNLKQYLNILEELKDDYPNIFSKIYKPPILTGIIDGFIGYGSEPALLPDGSFTSFNVIRSDAIQNGIIIALNEWIDQNLYTVVVPRNSLILKDYILMKLTDLIYKKLNNRLNQYMNKNKLDQFYDMYGLVFNDFQNNFLYNFIHNELDIKDILNSKTIDIPTRNGKKISIYDYEIDQVLRLLIKQILNFDSNFIVLTTQKINEESIKAGIDINKYCFDIKAKDALLNERISFVTAYYKSDPFKKGYGITR